MDFGSVIRKRLGDLELEQKDLAAAAEVTESYISQLLARKKAPPAPERTDIYDKMERFLKLPGGKLSTLADHERKEELKRALSDPPAPLHAEVRELILRKCGPGKERHIRSIFEKEPFGVLEHMVTQKLVDAVKNAVRAELESKAWLQLVAQRTSRSYKQIRVRVLEFLDTDVFSLSVEDCDSFLDPLIESWDVDFGSFGMEIVLNRRLAPEPFRRFEFVERESDRRAEDEPGFAEFLRDRALSRDASSDELAYLKSLRVKDKRPTALFYYRSLQTLRDPLHFRPRVGERK